MTEVHVRHTKEGAVISTDPEPRADTVRYEPRPITMFAGTCKHSTRQTEPQSDGSIIIDCTDCGDSWTVIHGH